MAGRVLLLAILLSSIVYPCRIEGADAAIDEKIKAIRQRYAKVERELKHYRQVKRDLSGESAEGGELKAYFKDRSVEKLSAAFLGETGKALEEYYFRNGELIFVFRVESRYTKPLSGVVKKKSEERFYFAEGKMIRWLRQGNKPIAPGADFDQRGGELQERAAKYKALAYQ